jgi:chromosome partitioning protein
MSPETLIFSNQKGGVGKTTLTRELGIYLSTLGHKVLLVDCDPQGNLTKGVMEGLDGGLFDALSTEGFPPMKLTQTLYLYAGDIRLAVLERNLIGEIDAYTRLRTLLAESFISDYEFVFLDTPPSLGVLTINALTAARHLVVPMSPSLYSMQGTNDLLDTVSKVRANLNPQLRLLGVIINAYDSVPIITRQIRSEIESSFGSKVFHTALSKSIKIEEAIAARQGLAQDNRALGTRARHQVAALGDELLRRLGRAVKPEAHHVD